jgi:hypothetical protein
MTGDGYTKQGTSSPAIGCETTVAKSSFSGTNPFFPFLLGGWVGVIVQLQSYYITLLFLLILFIHQTYIYIYIYI